MTKRVWRGAALGAAMVTAACGAPVPEPAEPMFLFGFDRESFGMDGVELASSLARRQAREGHGAVSVEGHADEAGEADYNLALSLRRAETVRRELLARGVPPGAVAVAALGETAPATPTADGAAEPANRRTTVSLAAPGAVPPPDLDRPISLPLP